MHSYKEKRSFERYHCKVPIICAHYNKEDYCGARTVNYSKGGLCFESDSPFRPGENVFIRTSKSFSQDADPEIHDGFRLVTLAEVRWLKEKPGPAASRYGVGVKYHIPV